MHVVPTHRKEKNSTMFCNVMTMNIGLIIVGQNIFLVTDFLNNVHHRGAHDSP